MNRVLRCTLLCLTVVLFACQTRELNTSSSYLTGWKTFDKTTTRFEAFDGYVSGVPQGMVPIEGGSFTIGQMDEFITAPHNSERRSVTVSSFYMDKYEVTNVGWREYESWIAYVFGRYNQAMVQAVKPDTLVWRSEMAYNEPYEENYYSHPAYSFYPVVGISWDQAMAFCQWRTDRVNEMLLVKSGEMEHLPYNLLNPNEYMTEAAVIDFLQNSYDHPEYAKYLPDTVSIPVSKALMYGYEGEEMVEEDEDGRVIDPLVTMYRLPYEWVRDQFVFNTEKYLYSSQYKPTFGKKARLDAYGEQRKVTNADGMLLIGYRLPTEVEWEYAAFAPKSNADGVPEEGRVYPWSGYHPRNLKGNAKGQMMANFVRSKGDVKGVAGAATDGYVITAPVDAFAPNDFGLYNMAGNVNEWVLDVYRETSFDQMSEYNPFRGNVYAHPKRDENGRLVISATGCIETEYTPEEDLRNFRDGDAASKFDTDYPLDTVGLTEEQLLNRKIDPTDILAPRITATTRVYKGGSWNDRIYWLNPTTRRFMDQSKASNTVGFRCAMTMIGDENFIAK